jgi:hypothetical protein
MTEAQQAQEATVLGAIIGKSTTREFSFQVENETKVFEYLKVHHRAFGDVLCQVIEITATREDAVALCSIIGYRDDDGAIKGIRIPFDVGSRVLRADDDFIRSIINLGDEHGAMFGKLEGRDIPVSLDLRKILTKHVAVLAKSGAGKSYSVGVLIEEVLERNVPLVIIDPHGEYSTLSQPNTEPGDANKLSFFGMVPKGYKVNEYGDPTVTNGRPLKLSNKMTQQELVQMIPAKLTGTQIGILYSALRNIDQVSFDAVIASLNAEESNAKWGLINILEHLRTYNIFSNEPTPYDEIVAPGTCSIINFRGIPAEIQSIMVYKLTKDLFEMRKRGALPPFFLVLEEAHNFCPERSFGETTASKTIRTIASEGRKFGLGLCVITQRPARLDKSVVSQCTTQIILKVTNPNDLKAISSSVEGLTAEAEKEIANLPIGTALVTGIVDVPLLVNVRPRRSLHGGHSIDIFSEIERAPKRVERKTDQGPKLTKPEAKLVTRAAPTPKAEPKPVPENPGQGLSLPMPVFRPQKGIFDKLLKDKPLSSVTQALVPAYLVTCTQGSEQFRLIVSRLDGSIVTSVNTFTTKKLPDLKRLSKEELKVLQMAYTTPTATRVFLGSVEMQSLIDKGYLTVENENIKLSDKYLFQKLSKVKSEDDLEMTRVSDASVQDPALTETDVKSLLSTFVTVKDIKECYVLRIAVK